MDCLLMQSVRKLIILNGEVVSGLILYQYNPQRWVLGKTILIIYSKLISDVL